VRRLRDLGLFALVVIVAVVALVVVLRRPIQRVMGVDVDFGPGGRAELVVPDGYAASVFATGLSSPRFMAVSADGTLFVADPGAQRVVALPDRDANGRADEVVEVGAGYESAHSAAFEGDGSLLVAGEGRLFRLELGPDMRERTRSVVLDGLPTGGHSTRTIAVLPDGQLLLWSVRAATPAPRATRAGRRSTSSRPRADRAVPT
jgi:glucose/arabinose dehydrogenase